MFDRHYFLLVGAAQIESPRPRTSGRSSLEAVNGSLEAVNGPNFAEPAAILL
jgi:hypothetical protein